MTLNKKQNHSAIVCTLAAVLAATSVTNLVHADSSGKAARRHTTIGEILPTGMRITPTAAHGAQFQPLNPDLASRPDYLADHAVDIVASPDAKTLLILTSGYNRMNDVNGSRVAAESNEYVFIYDISAGSPVKQQVIQVPNTYNGIAWNPNGNAFYVSGGVNDNLHVYTNNGAAWAEYGAPINLGHNNHGEGVGVGAMAAGVAVNQTGNRVLVANFENDSISLVDPVNGMEVGELDLRPGKTDSSQSGVAGGTYPFAVAFKGDGKAYVSSQRDREIVVVALDGDTMRILKRIKTAGQPTKMVMNKAQSKLFIASDNDDSVVVVDTNKDRVVEVIATIAPQSVFDNKDELKGANPSNVALSPDEATLFVTNGGTNSVAVIQLAHHDEHGAKESDSKVVGLIPTGWYPNAVYASQQMLYVVNSKGNAGPNTQACRDTVSIAAGSSNACNGANQYVWQLHKAGFLAMPVPSAKALADLTWQVAANNKFPKTVQHEMSKDTLEFVRKKIKHVIYVVKENRTYDQVLGALEVGNGDPSLAILAPYSPNHSQLARQFVALDNFYDSGETSNTGWNWTTAARSTDFTEKTSPVNYAGRGLTYDWEGANRNVAVSLSYAERVAAGLPADPDMLAGTADVAAPDTGASGEAGTGYLWNAALRAGLSVRNYGFYVANKAGVSGMTREQQTTPFAANHPHVVPLKQALADVTDVYFRGYDQSYPDYWRVMEWEREFDQFVQQGELPNLSLVRISHDHFGNYTSALDNVSTVEAQMADNDYAMARITEKVANSPFKDDTLIFVVEDDAQNGGDHVDAHRSIAYVVGPYVKQGAVVSEHYTTASMLRTIEDVLGMQPMGMYDGLTEPMAAVFDKKQKAWSYNAIVPEVLYTTTLPLPENTVALHSATTVTCGQAPQRSAAYWHAAMQGQDFSQEDRLDTASFNTALWRGLKGDNAVEPARHGRDLRTNRKAMLAEYRAKHAEDCAVTLSTAK